MLTLTQAEARSRVARGAQLVDAQWPGWDARLNRDTFNISSVFHCILAQNAGSFTGGLRDLWPDVTTAELQAHGFSLDLRGASDAEAEERWDILQTAWDDLLDARRSTPALAVPDLAQRLGVA